MRARSLLVGSALALGSCAGDDPYGLDAPSAFRVETIKYSKIIPVGPLDSVRFATTNYAELEARVSPRDWPESARPRFEPLNSAGRGHKFYFYPRPYGVDPQKLMSPGDTVANIIEIRGKNGQGLPVTLEGTNDTVLRLELKVYFPK